MKRALAVILSAGTAALVGCGPAAGPVMQLAPVTQAPAVRSQSVDGLKAAIRHLSESEFVAFDTNRDGIVTTAEAKMTPADFARVDANKDGQITRAEQTAYYEWISEGLVEFLHEESAKAFVRIDRNQDGFITIAEFRATLPQDPYSDHTRFAMGMFNTSDRNHDRQMDQSEYEDYEAWFIASLYDLDGMDAAATLKKAKAAAIKRTKTPRPAVRR